MDFLLTTCHRRHTLHPEVRKLTDQERSHSLGGMQPSVKVQKALLPRQVGGQEQDVAVSSSVVVTHVWATIPASEQRLRVCVVSK